MRLRWIVLVAITIALVIAGSGIASATDTEQERSYEDDSFTENTLASNSTTIPPTIDGNISAGEWITMIPITLNGFFDPTNTLEGELYVMHDANNIYIAVVIPDAGFDEDYIVIEFDQGNDNEATDGDEDAFGFDFWDLPPAYADLHWDSLEGWWIEDDDIHGEAEWSYDYQVGKYIYEFAKPLKSNDSQDIGVDLGDTLGFRIEVWDQTTEDYYRYPEDTIDVDTTRWDEWADLIIALP
jgi:hypothetical protein